MKCVYYVFTKHGTLQLTFFQSRKQAEWITTLIACSEVNTFCMLIYPYSLNHWINFFGTTGPGRPKCDQTWRSKYNYERLLVFENKTCYILETKATSIIDLVRRQRSPPVRVIMRDKYIFRKKKRLNPAVKMKPKLILVAYRQSLV